LPTDAIREAVGTKASTEGLLVDPVYGGNALAGHFQDILDGQFAAGANVLFVITGGLPGLFAYRREFRRVIRIPAGCLPEQRFKQCRSIRPCADET